MESDLQRARMGPAGATGAGLRGRGAADNPKNRFEPLEVVVDSEFLDYQRNAEDPPRLRTRYYRDSTRSIIAFNDSPDLPFDASLNPYRGCEHGCIYCYARPTHEYLGFSAGLDFESRILVKESAPELLRQKLASAAWKPQVVAVGTATDPYQPVEGRLRLTRRCLQVFAEYCNPLTIVTKSALVCRDIDVLLPLVEVKSAAVNVSITTLDRALSRIMEPRAAVPSRRLETVEALARAGIPVGVMVAPVIPGLTEHEIPGIVEGAARAGARWVTYVPLRLPHGVANLFEDWLERHFPDRKSKIMNRILATRGGRRNDPRFHSRMRGSGFFAEQIRALMTLSVRRAGLEARQPSLAPCAFRRPADPQLSLFGSKA